MSQKGTSKTPWATITPASSTPRTVMSTSSVITMSGTWTTGRLAKRCPLLRKSSRELVGRMDSGSDTAVAYDRRSEDSIAVAVDRRVLAGSLRRMLMDGNGWLSVPLAIHAAHSSDWSSIVPGIERTPAIEHIERKLRESLQQFQEEEKLNVAMATLALGRSAHQRSMSSRSFSGRSLARSVHSEKSSSR